MVDANVHERIILIFSSSLISNCQGTYVVLELLYSYNLQPFRADECIVCETNLSDVD